MMLAKIGKLDLLDSKDFLFEPKLDGYRALCIKKGDRLKFISRNDLDMTLDFPELLFKLKKDCILDGEIVMFDRKGNPSFSMMQRRSNLLENHATYVAFDILELEGKNVKDLDLSKRRELLLSVVEPSEFIQVVPSFDDGRKLWKIVTSRNLEGVMAKRKGSRYVDYRSSDWMKIKNELTADCIIIGFKSKVRKIGSLSLGLYDGDILKYIGQVGTGFSEQFLKRLEKMLVPIASPQNKVYVNKLPKDITPVMPNLVCEVKYLELTKDFRLRAPAFVRLRSDKKPKECTIDQVSYS